MLNLFNLPLYFMWGFPVLWVLGVDQLIIVPFLISFSIFIIYRVGRFIPPDFIESVFLLISIASFMSFFSSDNTGVWFRVALSFFTCFLYLYSIRLGSQVINIGVFDRNLMSIGWLAFLYVMFSFFVFLIKPDFSFNAVLAPLFPSGSDFFQTLKIRSLGASYSDFSTGESRFSGPFQSYSSMSMALFLILPFVFNRKFNGWLKFLAVIAMFFLQAYTGSRLGLYAMLIILAFLGLSFLKSRLSNIYIFLIFLVVAVGMIFLFSYGDVVLDYFYSKFFEVRPESTNTRLRIYEESLYGIWERPFSGWGNPRELDSTYGRYSAGTHGSYIAIAFMYGIPAAICYLFLWLYIYKDFLYMFFVRKLSLDYPFFIFSTALTVFSIREFADTWWWDHLLLFLFCNFVIYYRFKKNELLV